jgi:site-specific recombinase XerD
MTKPHTTGHYQADSCHSLRHTFGTHKAQVGVNMRQVQEWLDHASLETTQIYVHIVREDSAKIMERSSL